MQAMGIYRRLCQIRYEVFTGSLSILSLFLLLPNKGIGRPPLGMLHNNTGVQHNEESTHGMVKDKSYIEGIDHDFKRMCIIKSVSGKSMSYYYNQGIPTTRHISILFAARYYSIRDGRGQDQLDIEGWNQLQDMVTIVEPFHDCTLLGLEGYRGT